MDNGEDEVGNGHNGQHKEDTFVDAEDGNCITNGKKSEDEDEGDALGSRPMYGQVSARMPVHKNATHYKMDHKNRGLAIIFNQEHFEVPMLKSRSGTNADSENLTNTLRGLNFEVVVYKDLTYNNIEHHIRSVAEMDHTHNDCVLIALLTHGEMGIVYAKDTAYKPEALWSYFTADRCPTLAGKPKMFFIQACQGDNLDPGVTLRTETDGEIYSSYKIPVQADFLIVYSTVKGYFSWRNTTKGSWFVQALCERLQEHAAEYDLLTILTFVSQHVAFNFESNVPDSHTMHQQKQIPCIMSMLTRLIKFPVVVAGASGVNLLGSDKENNKIEQDLEKSRNLFSGIFRGSKMHS